MSDPDFYIESERLYISYFLPESDAHCDFLVKLYASMGGEHLLINNREAARERLAGRVRAEHARNGYGTYLVSLKYGAGEAPAAAAAGDVPIGTVSLLRGEEPNCYAAPDLGFAMLPEHKRRGYATEAARRLLEYAESEKGVRDVLGLCNPKNEASKGVFRKLGFEDCGQRALRIFGGIIGQTFVKPGMDHNLEVYGV